MNLEEKLQEEAERGKQLPSYKLLQEIAKEEIKSDDVTPTSSIEVEVICH